MKWILNVFLFGLMLTLSPMVTAADSDEENNYVSVNPIVNASNLASVDSKCATVDYQGTHVVNPQDYTICENDISYGILSMVFQKIFAENELLKALGNADEESDSVAYAYNIGGPIIAIIEAVTWLTFTLSGLVLTFVTIKTLNISASSGQFMGNWNSVYVMTRTLGAMALIVPVGSFSLAQIFILIIAMFGIMGGNYIWGAFLSMQQAETITLDEAGGNHIALSIAQAESLVKSNTCSIRSASASVEMHQKNLESRTFTDIDVTTHMSRLSNCSRNRMFIAVDQTFSTYEESWVYNVAQMAGPATNILASTMSKESAGNAFPVSTLAFGSPTTCNGDGDILNKFDEDTYGKSYQCGNIQFQTPDLEHYISGNSEVDDEGLFVSTKKSVIGAVEDIKASIEPNDFYAEISKKGYNLSIGGTEFHPNDYESEVARFKEMLIQKGSALFKEIKSNIESNSPNPPAAYEGTYVALAATLNNYLGGGYNRAGYDSFWETLKSTEVSWGTIKQNKAVQIYTEDERGLDLNGMYVDAKKSALHLVAAKCAEIWPVYRSAYNSTNVYFEKLTDPKTSMLGEPNMELNLNGTINSECIQPFSESELSNDRIIKNEYIRLADVTDTKDSYYLLLNNNAYGNTLVSAAKDSDITPEELDVAVQELMKSNIDESNAIIDGMSAYNYVIRKGMEEAIKEVFTEETNTDFLIEMRNLGWASAGGFILALSNEGSELAKYNRLIQGQVTWNAAVSNEKYINSTRFLESNGTLEYSSLTSVARSVFSDAVMNADYEDLKEKDTYELNFSIILKFLEDLLTAPLHHLKAVGGFDQNSTLRDGAKKCYEAGECTITSVHPVTALLNVGNDLIDLCFNLVLLKTITGAIVWLDVSSQKTSKATAGGKSGESPGMIASMLGATVFQHPVVKTIFKVVGIVDSILGVIVSTIVPPLFIVGIFFSFVIPMMPFLAFLMGFIGWIMLILELLIAVNVWILLMATPDQNGNSRADPRAVFGFAGQLILKPALMVIALVFGWYLSAISVYFLNMTIFGALSPTESGSLLGLLDLAMFYIVYLIMIFIAIKHSFKIIEILPDKIFSLINISKSGDIKSESLGMERMVQLAAGEKVLSLSQTPMQMIDKKKEAAKMDLKKFKSELARDERSEALRELRANENAQKGLDEANQNGEDTKAEDDIMNGVKKEGSGDDGSNQSENNTSNGNKEDETASKSYGFSEYDFENNKITENKDITNLSREELLTHEQKLFEALDEARNDSEKSISFGIMKDGDESTISLGAGIIDSDEALAQRKNAVSRMLGTGTMTGNDSRDQYLNSLSGDNKDSNT